MGKIQNPVNFSVLTDCGEITVCEYDDEIANGIKIYLGDTLVAMVDCYRKPVLNLPRATKEIDLEEGEDPEEAIANKLSDIYGYCVNNFKYSVDETTSPRRCFVWEIDWDISGVDEPEARLLVYGPEGPDFDEPNQVITLN